VGGRGNEVREEWGGRVERSEGDKKETGRKRGNMKRTTSLGYIENIDAVGEHHQPRIVPFSFSRSLCPETGSVQFFIFFLVCPGQTICMWPLRAKPDSQLSHTTLHTLTH
jgi:hypothetical protein